MPVVLRPVVVRLLLLSAAVATAVAVATPAEAASYRYWTYWWGAPAATSWSFAVTGPASHVPADGAVEGWRFQATTSSAGGSTPADGRAPSSVFAELCGTGSAPPGRKRVAVVVDYGTSADAPPGQSPPTPRVRGRCVTTSPGATGGEVITAATSSMRFDSGLLCALDGYPAGECAPVVGTGPFPTPPRPTTPTSTARPSRPTPSPPVATTTAAAPSGTAPRSASSPAARPAATGPTSGSALASGPGGPTPATATTAAGPSDLAASPISTAVPVPTSQGSGAPWTAALGVVLVAGLGAAAAARMRRSR
jgi:hypothetical protein